MNKITLILIVGLSAEIAVAGPINIHNSTAAKEKAVEAANATNVDASVTWQDIRDQQQAALDALQAIDVTTTGTLGVAIAAIDPSTLAGAAKTQAQATKAALQAMRQTLQDVKAAIRQDQGEVRRMVRKLKAQDDDRKSAKASGG